MKHIISIREIVDDYDAFIIDLWGVMHDGTALYPNAKDALAYLHSTGKPVVFLSNAPRKAEKAATTLNRLGVSRDHYHAVVTSGQVAFDRLASSAPYGTCYYYLGPGKDEDVLEGLEGYEQVSEPTAADFILNAGFEEDYQPVEEIEPLLATLLSNQLPLFCINPDIEVVKQDGTRLLCAGWVARRYEELGGTVHYVGKPHPAVYHASLETLNHPARPLAIGDNLHTDIKGANAQGIDCLLITGGILKSEAGQHPSAEQLTQLCKESEVNPTYVAELFAA